MAIDESILLHRMKASVPNTLRFYCWEPSAVSIGKFQTVENEVHLSSCKQLGVDVVRRITGGGTVYHDSQGEITYSVVVNKEDLGIQDIEEVYAKIYAGIAQALKILGTEADFNEGNVKACPNLTVQNKKISGSAQCHKKGVVLQHGTLLIDVDLERMFTFLRVHWAAAPVEVARIAEGRITSIKKEIAKKISADEVEQALVDGFKETLHAELVDDALTSDERKLAEKLIRQKYSTERWNFRAEIEQSSFSQCAI
jgi:lipoate-protein ligase A